jgi:hypothetical protein
MQRPDLVERSLLPRLHEAPEMPPFGGNAAIKPRHCVKHDRITKNSPIPDVVPATTRSAKRNDAVVAMVSGCRMTSPLGAIPIAVLVGSLRVSIPPNYRLTVHRCSLPPAQVQDISGRRKRAGHRPRPTGTVGDAGCPEKLILLTSLGRPPRRRNGDARRSRWLVFFVHGPLTLDSRSGRSSGRISPL